jgi:hypothetical protein
MVGLTFAVLAVVVLGLVVVALGLALERHVGRDRAKPRPSHRPTARRLTVRAEDSTGHAR